MSDPYRSDHSESRHPGSGFFSTRKRRAFSVIASIAILAVVLLGVQSWRIVNALVDAERTSYVPLPPSSQSAYLQDIPSASDAYTFDPDVSRASSDEKPSANVSVRLEPSIPGVSYGVPGAGESDQNVAEDNREDTDEPSHLEVAQQLVEAGMEGGDPGTSSVWDGKTSLNILVLGVDRREDDGDQNADVIIIVRLDLIDKSVQGVSIPRDLLVEIPEIGPDKINGSYNHGHLSDPENPASGVALVRDTIESVFKVPIDDYVLVDFQGFEEVVDALGGVMVDIPYDIVDTEYPTLDYGTQVIEFEAGERHLDGESALKYVRTRHADGDDARRQRQIDVIVAALNSGQSLSSIHRTDELIVAAGDAVQTSFDLEEQLTLARLAAGMSEDDVEIMTLTEPLIESGWTDEGSWVYLGDASELSEFVRNALVNEGQ